jgi:uncharacterized protein (TIGR02145 family)
MKTMKTHIKMTKNKNRRWLPKMILGPFLLIGFFIYSCGGSQGQKDEEQQDTLTDTEGYRYETLSIGDQTWMAENLRTAFFSNGDPIFHAQTEEEWKKAGREGEPAWCYYENDPANGKIYGKLYNWYAISDTRGLAPEGWKIPSDDDWFKITEFLGGEAVAGEKMKNTSGWEINGTNDSGFSGLPGGYRSDEIGFRHISRSGVWWSSTVDGNGRSYPVLTHSLSSRNSTVFRGHAIKADGFSVRLIKTHEAATGEQ